MSKSSLMHVTLRLPVYDLWSQFVLPFIVTNFASPHMPQKVPTDSCSDLRPQVTSTTWGFGTHRGHTLDWNMVPCMHLSVLVFNILFTLTMSANLPTDIPQVRKLKARALKMQALKCRHPPVPTCSTTHCLQKDGRGPGRACTCSQVSRYPQSVDKKVSTGISQPWGTRENLGRNEAHDRIGWQALGKATEESVPGGKPWVTLRGGQLHEVRQNSHSPDQATLRAWGKTVSVCWKTLSRCHIGTPVKNKTMTGHWACPQDSGTACLRQS